MAKREEALDTFMPDNEITCIEQKSEKEYKEKI